MFIQIQFQFPVFDNKFLCQKFHLTDFFQVSFDNAVQVYTFHIARVFVCLTMRHVDTCIELSEALISLPLVGGTGR